MLRLVSGFVLALPSLLLTVCVAPILMLLSLPSALLLRHTKASNNDTKAKRRQVFITGGSSGIGWSLAQLVVQQPNVERVVLIARTLSKLQEAQTKLKAINDSVTVEIVSLDVSDAPAVEKAVSKLFQQKDKDDENMATHLFCCAGEPLPNYYSNITPQQYQTILHTNLLGSMYVTNNVLQQIQRGTVTLLSSMGGQVGVFGMTAYSASKFALKGYAEALSMECFHSKPHIHIQVAYPPDTDTPGFARENKDKPMETKLISETAGLMSPDNIATTLWNQAATVKRPPFAVYFNFDGFLLCTLTTGFGPVSSVFQFLCEISILNLTRWIAILYLNDWHRLIGNYQQREANKKQA